jgi:chromatin remodeling complex protein RSC6
VGVRRRADLQKNLLSGKFPCRISPQAFTFVYIYISDPLAAVLQYDKLSRPQVVKQLWVYIKGNELQNPGNRREILCDAGLRAVFGVDKIDMFKMNKVLGQ